MRRYIRIAVIAALYLGLCLLFLPFSYGPVQFRVGEALVLLVVLCPDVVWAVTIGCLLSNIVSFSPVDMAIGPLATLLATMLSYELKDYRLFKTATGPGLALPASIPPVVVNAVIIGFELSFFFGDGMTLQSLATNMLRVGAGQIVCCSILGVGLVWVVEKTPRLKQLLQC